MLTVYLYYFSEIICLIFFSFCVEGEYAHRTGKEKTGDLQEFKPLLNYTSLKFTRVKLKKEIIINSHSTKTARFS